MPFAVRTYLPTALSLAGGIIIGNYFVDFAKTIRNKRIKKFEEKLIDPEDRFPVHKLFKTFAEAKAC